MKSLVWMLLWVVASVLQAQEVTHEVDATDLDRKVMRVRTSYAAAPGPMALRFPRWIPGTHAPSGDVGRLAGLRLVAGGQPLAWQRDSVDTHLFRFTVPAGAQRVEAEYEFLSPMGPETARVVVTREMLNVQWNDTLLYPAGADAKTLRVAATLRIPDGWTQASALRVARQDGGTVRYEPETLERLIDSPVFAGRHVRRIELDAPGTPRPVALNIVADEARHLAATDAQIEAHRRIVAQADRVFGARPFRRYEFLLALSEELSPIGLEHLESSENGVRPRYWEAWDRSIGSRELLPHEYAHAWNGKYRRPVGLATGDFATPMRGDLLWVYEGQTEYWGKVLAARAGLVSPELMRDSFAQLLADVQLRSGRQWRDLQDTTNEPAIGRRTARDWPDWQRNSGIDYYNEGTLIWLEADALIRQGSGGARSLDDFARAFFAATDGGPGPRPYTFDDVVRALAGVHPHDWARFLRERLALREAADVIGAFERGTGWRLAWSDTPSENWKAGETFQRSVNHLHSIGLRVASADGRIGQVAWQGPAFNAGIAPGATIVAVNSRAWKPEGLAAAIAANRDGSAPIELLLREGDRFRTVRVDWRGGLRYPKLERVAGSEDGLAKVLEAR